MASETAAVAAGQQILVGQTVLVLAVRGNAQTVRGSLGSAESPAGTADGLVANLLQRGALGPLLDGVELGGQVLANLDLLHGQINTSVQGTEVLSVVTRGDGLVSQPGRMHGVHFLRDFHESGRMGQSQGQNCKHKERSHFTYEKIYECCVIGSTFPYPDLRFQETSQFSMGRPATLLLSMPHSSLPMMMRK